MPDFADLGRVDLRGMRIGVPYAARGIEMCSAVEAAIHASVASLSNLGATVVDIELPRLKSYYDPANAINKAEGSAIHAQTLRTRRNDYSPAVLARLDGGLLVPATQYLDALRARARLLRESVATIFERVDALHLPTVGIETPTLAESVEQGSALLESFTAFTRWVNYLGLPALSVPCGFTPRGMPVGFQLIGRPFSERRLFRIGHAYQQATTWHAAMPGQMKEAAT